MRLEGEPVATLDQFIAVDVETASRSRRSVCALAAARFELGRETGSFKSLVHVDGPVRFGRIHGIEAADLAAAPPWPTVWHRLLEFIGDIREVVAYRAEFDRGAILAMCASHNIRVPILHFTCAAKMIETRFAGNRDLAEALTLLGLPFPGRHHDPLADARAAAAIAIACMAPRPPSGAP